MNTRQPSLFEDTAAALPVVGVPGSQRALSKGQKRFNSLIAKIEAQKRVLAQWHDFLPIYGRRSAAEMAPVAARLRERQIEMTALLDRAAFCKGLGKSQRAKARHLLLELLNALLEEQEQADLIQLHDKHSERTYEQEQEALREFAREMAGGVLGIDAEALGEAASDDELARLLADKLEADHAADRERRRGVGTKRNAKSAARDALREQAAQGASRALREVYRRLVGELHPDRARDADERSRKTALMQDANRAYDAGDLLALLELQLKVEQIDPASLADLAEERVAHYNHVLEEQLERLNEELVETMAPFMGAARAGRFASLTTDSVLAWLDDQVRELETAVHDLERDLVEFGDVTKLKRSLRDYRIPRAVDEDELALIAEMMAFPASVQRHRRRR